MKEEENKETSWTSCLSCKGTGNKTRKLRKKVRLQYQLALMQIEMALEKGPAPIRPKGHLYTCPTCSGTGLIPAISPPIADKESYPHVAIIGNGIAGIALAVACLHRSIPFTLFERDERFDVRSQGYGLTLQQASKAIKEFGIISLKEQVISTRHVVHTTTGEMIGEWGIRKWLQSDGEKTIKRTNVHIARQSLRAALIAQLGGNGNIQWGHQLIGFKPGKTSGTELSFLVNGQLQHAQADLVVGADGIRSSVRKELIGEQRNPLHYLGCMVILGICSLDALGGLESPLLDSATVFQTANGHDRIYVMPFSSDSVMWQLSFPMQEMHAKDLSTLGAQALKKEASHRTMWHAPIPQLVAATPEHLISGYPVYDRELLDLSLMENAGPVTLIGDAAHPMSPFKGQGANQALLDSLALAREITKGCRPKSQWREAGLRKSVLMEFESKMLTRSAKKVKDSAAAAQFLHSDIVLYEGDEPRGRCLLNRTL